VVVKAAARAVVRVATRENDKRHHASLTSLTKNLRATAGD
jgi:hypothetical protein